MNRHLEPARLAQLCFVAIAVFATSGCGTTTQKLATEQLLISDAVDQAVNQIDFGFLANQDVFLDTTFIKSVKGVGFANTDYIVSALRAQLATAGCRVHDDRNAARIIVEPRIGALGTDGHEVTYGIPQTGSLTTAAAALTNAPVVPSIPEIAFGKSDKQLGIAKIMLFAYDRESKVAVWQSGLQQSESTCTNTWVMGAGPIQRGSIYDGFRFAGKNINNAKHHPEAHKILADLNAKTDDEKEQENDKVEVADESSADGKSDSSIVR